jgi:hypothetical protein
MYSIDTRDIKNVYYCYLAYAKNDCTHQAHYNTPCPGAA